MSTTREAAESIARRSLPFSAFRNESEWKDTIAFLTNAIDKALQAERERAAKIVNDARFEGGADLRELASRIREGRPLE